MDIPWQLCQTIGPPTFHGQEIINLHVFHLLILISLVLLSGSKVNDLLGHKVKESTV